MTTPLPVTQRKLVKRRDIDTPWLRVWWGGGYLQDWTPSDVRLAVAFGVSAVGFHFNWWHRPRVTGRRYNLAVRVGQRTWSR